MTDQEIQELFTKVTVVIDAEKDIHAIKFNHFKFAVEHVSQEAFAEGLQQGMEAMGNAIEKGLKLASL